jgi:hypothetical protein
MLGCCCTVQISQAFKPDHDDVEYAQGKFMLRNLGLQVRTLWTPWILSTQSCSKAQSWKGTVCVATTYQDHAYSNRQHGALHAELSHFSKGSLLPALARSPHVLAAAFVSCRSMRTISRRAP